MMELASLTRQLDQQHADRLYAQMLQQQQPQTQLVTHSYLDVLQQERVVLVHYHHVIHTLKPLDAQVYLEAMELVPQTQLQEQQIAGQYFAQTHQLVLPQMRDATLSRQDVKRQAQVALLLEEHALLIKAQQQLVQG